VGVEESLDRLPDGYAELAGGVGDDGERLFQLIFGLVSKSGARVARGSCQRGRSVGVFFGQPVQDGAAAPTEMIVGHHADAGRAPA
jgi:hypothetical protein